MRSTAFPWPAGPWLLNPLALLLLLWIGGSGCARFEARPVSLEATADLLEQRRLAAPDVRAFVETNLGPVAAWPPAAWTFDQLALAAVWLHPDLAVARAGLAESSAAVLTAGARPNPTIGVTPEYNFNPASGVSPWIATLQFDLPIETAGKRGHRMNRARQLGEAARLRLGLTAWTARAAVRDGLLELADARQRATLLDRQSAAVARVAQSLEARLTAGAASASDVAPARLALARAQAAVATERARETEARVHLAAALGLSPSALPPDSTLPLSLPGEDSAPLRLVPGGPEARRKALTSRADLLAALAEHAAAESALQLEIARQYPDIHLGTGYQWDQGENKWALGLTAELPVLNRNEGPIAEARARRDATAAQAVALQFRVMTELDSAQAAVAAARDRFAAANAALDAQRTLVAGLRAQLEAGAADVLETLQAESEQAAAELTLWEARVGLARAHGRLEDAVQAPFPAFAAAVASAGSTLGSPARARPDTSSRGPSDARPRATDPSRR